MWNTGNKEKEEVWNECQEYHQQHVGHLSQEGLTIYSVNREIGYLYCSQRSLRKAFHFPHRSQQQYLYISITFHLFTLFTAGKTQKSIRLLISVSGGKSVNSSVVSDTSLSHGMQPSSFLSPWNSPEKNIGMGSYSLLQGNLPEPGIEPRILALQADSSVSEPPGKPISISIQYLTTGYL